MNRDKNWITVDGNEAVASVAHRLSEVIAIYPITPSSAMGELADEWSAAGRRNVWDAVPQVVEMQSEGGAAGAVHGALQAGALATTFTSSQGLLLMIPNMYKIAGELTPFAMHVAARTLATHALSIFGDHSDVMACRQTGFALLASGSVQEAQDMAAIAHAATLECRIPFLHFFDGFRTSHEVAKIERLSDEDLKALVSDQRIAEHRARALTPDRPVIRGTAQNPDVFFQAREACNPFFAACPHVVRETMERFAAITGRRYGLFDYVGDPEAEHVVVVMGSGAEVVHETVEWMAARGVRVGVLKVRLFRPFSGPDFIAALPPTAKKISVLDRTKEPGAIGEPLYQDVVTALAEARDSGLRVERFGATVVGGRYGLSSKEFHPGMVKAVFDALRSEKPKNHFTVGIQDDISGTSLPFDGDFDIEPSSVVRGVFFGLGADGTVSANKNSIKIIGETTEGAAQGYFVYDSKKSGAITISHLRFGPAPIRSSYLVRKAQFVACHQVGLLDRYDVLGYAAEGANVLLNCPGGAESAWNRLPQEAQQQILEKRLAVHAIDADRVAREMGLTGRINTIMQTCFFAISGILPREDAIRRIKQSIAKSYGKKGADVLAKNLAAVDRALENLARVEVPDSVTSAKVIPFPVPDDAPDFVRRVTATIIAGHGDALPVSAFPPDGTWPSGTSRYEKRNIADEIPVWDPSLCIQCNKCVLVCPHAAIRAKVYEPAFLEGAPAGFLADTFRGLDFKDWKYTIQVAPEDCTGCSLCVVICPAHDKKDKSRKSLRMEAQPPRLEAERNSFEFFEELPEVDRTRLRVVDVKGSQFFQPLFEYSGACSGCGETPYIKLLTQLFGDRTLIANATGCSSIYGGNLPTTPYTKNREGRGPAWANSLFEDNAEFGLGFRLAADGREDRVRNHVARFADLLAPGLVDEILRSPQGTEAQIAAQRDRVEKLRAELARLTGSDARQLEIDADALVKKSVWIVGGDGWAYDIGFGGLDHVLASGRNVNVLVLDSEVYSNTGGQQSKATPLGAAAKFAAAGKETGKKDLGLMAMTYGNVYVARIAFGAKDHQTVKALLEAESYPGPSLVIAYAHCIAHGYDMADGTNQQKLAVDSGTWPLYRFDPRRIAEGQPPLQLDSPPAKIPIEQYMHNENRFRMLERADAGRWRQLVDAAQKEVERRTGLYQKLAALSPAGWGAAESKKPEPEIAEVTT
ncbi:MAG TPA: pyruvate:ferredoxin (flavodoxin) oxidoreductase [Thermoanaerobaculia bacterium]